MPVPLYLVSADPARRSRLTARLGPHVRAFEDVAELEAADALEPGIALVDHASTPPADALGLALRFAETADWTVALVAAGGDPEVRTVSIGSAATLKETRERAAAPSDFPGVLMALRPVLVEVARVRHDLNNPLTTALAEIQLLLLDADDPEVLESLEVVQAQLRRLRDMLAATSHLKPPRTADDS